MRGRNQSPGKQNNKQWSRQDFSNERSNNYKDFQKNGPRRGANNGEQQKNQQKQYHNKAQRQKDQQSNEPNDFQESESRDNNRYPSNPKQNSTNEKSKISQGQSSRDNRPPKQTSATNQSTLSTVPLQIIIPVMIGGILILALLIILCIKCYRKWNRKSKDFGYPPSVTTTTITQKINFPTISPAGTTVCAVVSTEGDQIKMHSADNLDNYPYLDENHLGIPMKYMTIEKNFPLKNNVKCAMYGYQPDRPPRNSQQVSGYQDFRGR